MADLGLPASLVLPEGPLSEASTGPLGASSRSQQAHVVPPPAEALPSAAANVAPPTKASYGITRLPSEEELAAASASSSLGAR